MRGVHKKVVMQEEVGGCKGVDEGELVRMVAGCKRVGEGGCTAAQEEGGRASERGVEGGAQECEPGKERHRPESKSM